MRPTRVFPGRAASQRRSEADRPRPARIDPDGACEPLRVLEAGMRIDAMEVGEVPLGVDTARDLVPANEIPRSRSRVAADER